VLFRSAEIRETRPDSRSSRGFSIFSPISLSRYSNSLPPAANRSSGEASRLMSALLLSWKKSWSAYGTPSNWQITRDGTGSANACTRSTGLGPASRSSISSSTSSRTPGRMASIRLIMNGAVTIRRRRACSGSSMRMKLIGAPAACPSGSWLG
jgi:hypothetical protein